MTVLLAVVATMSLQAQIIKPSKGKQVAESVKNGFNTAIDAISQDVKATGTHDVLDGYFVPKAGLNLSSLTSVGGNPIIGFTGGFGVEVFVHPHVSLGLELLYSHQGTAGVYYDTGGSSADGRYGPCSYSLDYFNTSALARWYPRATLPLSVYGGITLARCFNAKFEGEGSKTNLYKNSHVHRGDFSIPVGASYEFGQWAVDLRYNISFFRLANTERARQLMGNAKNMRLEATVAYRILVF